MISRRDAPQWAKDTGRAVTRAGGRLTAGARLLPAFLMVGTQRGGTTSLFRALAEHPALAPPVLHKGVHYFDVSYHRGLDWYRGHFPLRAVAARRAGGLAPLAFESAGYYMHHPLAAGRIARDLPEVRLIALLRDPVERAHSAHKHELARGFETEPFERAVELEPERLAGEVARVEAEPGHLSHSHRHHSYLDRGQYAEQLERLFGLFGRERVLVLYAEDLFADPGPCFDQITEFLGLPRWRPAAFDQHNARPGAPLPGVLRARLEAHFAPYDEKLAVLLGEPPAWRRR